MSWVPRTYSGLFGGNIKKWAYNLSRFNQYGRWIRPDPCYNMTLKMTRLGLHHDDCLHETEIVEEALRRLPQQQLDERNFRIVRAMQLSLTKSILPKEQWTKYEEDVRYLRPIIEEVIKERAEQEEWNKK